MGFLTSQFMGMEISFVFESKMGNICLLTGQEGKLEINLKFTLRNVCKGLESILLSACCHLFQLNFDCKNFTKYFLAISLPPGISKGSLEAIVGQFVCINLLAASASFFE